MQEWILNYSGCESGAVERSDEARGATTAPRHREWEALLTENAPLAFRVARGVLRNDADAEDVAQEALVRAYQRFERLRERQRFRAWLVRITFRIALDRLRSAKRRQQREAEWVVENTRTATSGAGAEFQQHLERALEEVGALLGLPLGTVKSRLFFAKKALAEKLRCFVNPTKTP